MWVQPLGWEDPLEEVWKCIPVFLPGESHGQRSLAGYNPQGCKEVDTTERLSTHRDRGAWQTTVHVVTKESDMTWQLNNSNQMPCLF